MKILFDHQCFWEKYGGVSKYFVELLKRLPSDAIKLSLKYTNNEYIHDLTGIKTHRFFPNINFKGKSTITNELGKLFSIPILIGGGFDIYHPTHYDCYGLRFIPKQIKTVATIHDMNFFIIPQYYDNQPRLAQSQKEMAQNVNHIITISNNTKTDLVNTWGIPNEKISVIYHGISLQSIQAAPTNRITDPYILYVGRRSAYKNFHGLLQAFSKLSFKYPALKLFCTGMPLCHSEFEEIGQLGLSDKIKVFQSNDFELYNLYRNAIAFVFPSFYEGFGLPILEAMANHCPIALSDTSCFPEIATDAGLYFNPTDIDDMVDKIELLINDSALRKTLIKKGALRVTDFSWDKCARQHLEVYKSLI